MARANTEVESLDLLREEQGADEINLLELFYRLLEKFRIILAAGLIGAILMGVYSFFIATPMYEATSEMYILSSKDSAINLSDLQIGAALTSDYEEVLRTWEVEALVRQNLDLPYTNKQLKGMISIANPSNTRILKITATSADPQEAKDIANEYVAVAREYISSVMMTDAPTTLSEAILPQQPVSPRKARNIALGFIVGALIAIVIITIVFISDDKIKTSDDIRKYIGLPTLAVVAKDPGVQKANQSSSSQSSGKRRDREQK
ncbi:MAG: polysaccharide export protein [Clostridiales bacterium]|nr:polysaccharide export protein [Clostridiales bacterium]